MDRSGDQVMKCHKRERVNVRFKLMVFQFAERMIGKIKEGFGLIDEQGLIYG